MSDKIHGELRELTEGDLDMLRQWRNAPAVRSRMYTQHEIGVDEHLSWFRAKSASPRDRLFIYSYLGTPTGFVSFSELNQDWGTGTWAFYAAPDAGRGVGSRMEFLALDHFFFDLQMRKLCCQVLSSNPAVIRLHEKHGFKQEGLRRAHVPMGADYDDIHELALFKDEWQERRDTMSKRLESSASKDAARW